MGEQTEIAWTDHTFNPWWGCARVSPGCEHCYAEASANRWGFKIWGREGERREMSEAYWRQPLKWNRQAQEEGRRRRVFCASMADVFEDHPVAAKWRPQLFHTIEETPWLDWQLLTKRPENMNRFAPAGWFANGWPVNVWAGTTVEDQRRANERILELCKVPAVVRFLSCEPLLEHVNLGLLGTLPSTITGSDYRATYQYINWVIIGGESGQKARPFELPWARAMVEECRDAGVAVFVKQLGDHALEQSPSTPGLFRLRLEKPKGGDMSEFPYELRVREFPESAATAR